MQRRWGILLVLAVVGCGSKENAGNGADATANSTGATTAANPGATTGERLIAPELSQEVDVVAQQPKLVIKNFKGNINNVAWSPDSSHVTVGTKGSNDDQGKLSPPEVRVWDAATGKEAFTVGTPNAITSGVSWSPDGAQLAIKSGGLLSFTEGTQEPGKLRIVAAQTGDPQLSIEVDNGGLSEVITWSPDGKSLAGLCGDGIVIWEAATGKPVQTLSYADSEHSALCLDWSPEGTRIAAGCDEGRVDLWDVAGAKVVQTFEGGSLKIGNQSIKLPSYLIAQETVLWSPNGKLVVSGSNNKVQIWNVQTGNALGSFEDATACLAWSPDGARLAGSTQQQAGSINHSMITIWNVQRNVPGKSFVAHERGVVSLAWSPDGTRLVSGGQEQGDLFQIDNSALKIWMVATD